mmetsp:Transcript_8918/g.13726  ORF Transcript_8918/g.13726 Transcript_8918/m.13726 type:complete len:84 (+) Transcript_8918:167-418(+)
MKAIFFSPALERRDHPCFMVVVHSCKLFNYHGDVPALTNAGATALHLLEGNLPCSKASAINSQHSQSSFNSSPGVFEKSGAEA